MLIAIPATGAALLAADTAAWWWLTTRLMAEAAAWRQARQAAGYVVQAQPGRRAGWPLRAEVVLPATSIATGGANGLAWQAAGFRLVYRPWRPGVVSIAPEGVQTLRIGEAAPIRIDAGRMVVEATSSSVTASARGLRLSSAAGVAAAESARLVWRDGSARLTLAGAALPGGALPFGPAWLEAHARSTQPFPPMQDLPGALKAWRDAGGRLVLSGVSFRWGPLHGAGDATIGLDGVMQPEATGLLQVTGFAAAIDALVRSGALTPNRGRVAQTLLSLVSSAGPDGAPQAVLPFSVHGGVLATGAIPLLRLPWITVPPLTLP